MFLRFLTHSIGRSPRRKVMAVAAVAMGSAVATAMLGVMLDIGDRVNRELRSLGANLMVEAKSRALPVEIGGVNYRPAAKDAFVPESMLPKIKSIFWHLNITGIAPTLEATAKIRDRDVRVDGVWFARRFRASRQFDMITGLRALNPRWKLDGVWIADTDSDDRGGNDCMLGSALARRLGLRPGATVELFGEPFHVSGLLSTGGEEDDRTFVRLEVLQRLTNRPQQVDFVQVGALTKPEDNFARKDPVKMSPAEFERWNCTPYVSSIAHQIEQALPATVARPIRRVAENEGKVLVRVRGLMLLICLAALASAGLTVWSVMAATVLERRDEIAIMQAIGGARWLIAAFFAGEVALESAAGGILGVLAGLQLAKGVERSAFQVSPELPALLAPLVILVAVAVALLGAAQPLKRSLQLEPALALKGDA